MSDDMWTPDTIYLTEVDFEDPDFPLIWASMSGDSGGTPYVPADRIAALEAENARLKEAERTAWERGLDKAWRSIKGQIGKDLKAYDCKDAGEGYDLAINDAVETIQSLTPEASHD